MNKILLLLLLLLLQLVACKSPEPPTTTEIDSSNEQYVTVSNNRLKTGGKKEFLKIAASQQMIYLAEDLTLRNGKELDTNRITDPRKLTKKLDWNEKDTKYRFNQFAKCNDLVDTFDRRCIIITETDFDTNAIISSDTCIGVTFLDKWNNNDVMYFPMRFIEHLRKK